ncbi:MAG: RagB/SusD family nutrient uptake outer membrane protein [Butyricimonas faecihominis]
MKKSSLVEGEALALRAFLHFDLLRGFAPSYKMGANDPGIPYVKEATNQVVMRSTVAATLDLILGDLKKAQELLRPVDPIGPSFGEYEEEDEYSADDYVTDDGFWLYRKSRFYYGVTADGPVVLQGGHDERFGVCRRGDPFGTFCLCHG